MMILLILKNMPICFGVVFVIHCCINITGIYYQFRAISEEGDELIELNRNFSQVAMSVTQPLNQISSLIEMMD